MKLKSIHLSSMDHCEITSFYQRTLSFLKENNATALHVISEKFEKAIKDYQDSLKANYRIILKKKIKQEQTCLGRFISLLETRVRDNLNSSDPKIFRLGRQIHIILDYYRQKGFSFTKTYTLGQIIDALEDFMTEKDRKEAGIAIYVKNMRLIYKAIKEMEKEYQHAGEGTDLDLLEKKRKKADSSYRELIRYINKQLALYPYEVNLNNLVNSFNTLINTECQWAKVKERIHKMGIEENNTNIVVA